jgi:hypothetical protein
LLRGALRLAHQEQRLTVTEMDHVQARCTAG